MKTITLFKHTPGLDALFKGVWRSGCEVLLAIVPFVLMFSGVVISAAGADMHKELLMHAGLGIVLFPSTFVALWMLKAMISLTVYRITDGIYNIRLFNPISTRTYSPDLGDGMILWGLTNAAWICFTFGAIVFLNPVLIPYVTGLLMFIGTYEAIVYLGRKVFRISVKLNNHINDKNAHRFED